MAKPPKGFFEYALGFDSETSGYASNSINPVKNASGTEHYQMVSIGLVIVDVNTFKELDELYLEIKWNGTSNWSEGAQAVHKLSKEKLERTGVSEAEAVVMIGNFLLKHFGPNGRIHLLGHNVVAFDRPFLFDLFERYGIILQFGSRHIDTFGISMATIGAYNSDDMFDVMGMETRTEGHNALQDIKYTIEVVRKIKLFWKKKINLLY